MPDPIHPSLSASSHCDLIRKCFAELHGEREHFSEFLGQSFAQLDGWRDQIEQHWHQLTEERSELVRKALSLLPSRERELLLLKYTENWTYRELADHLGLTQSAVESRLHRARRRLREKLATLHVMD